MSKITFLRVVNNQQKINRIVKSVRHFYEMGKQVAVVVSSGQAAAYIDDLLWSFPEESFLPHSLLESKIKETVVVSDSVFPENAEVLINLTNGLPEIPLSGKIILELLDETSPERKNISEKKIAGYKQLNLAIRLS